MQHGRPSGRKDELAIASTLLVNLFVPLSHLLIPEQHDHNKPLSHDNILVSKSTSETWHAKAVWLTFQANRHTAVRILEAGDTANNNASFRQPSLYMQMPLALPRYINGLPQLHLRPQQDSCLPATTA